MARSASSFATITTMPMPQLNTRCISASATRPCSWSHWNSGGRVQASFWITAVTLSASTRGTFSVRPPPVMWAMPLTGSVSISESSGFT
ncbi:hypothetical protein D3C86_1505730 [compost metagenome]